MEQMHDLEAFLAIVETGSQTGAARQLGRSLQAVNRSLLALERSLGVALIQRTTRKSRPTEAGLAFYARVKPAYMEIVAAGRDASAHDREPSGRLRIAAPLLFGPAYVVPVACAFMKRHPRVEVDLSLSDQPARLIEDDLDVAIRIRDLPDSTLKSRRLGTLRTVVFGAPRYFAAHGRPRHPDDLLRHHCVIRMSDAGADTWPFRIDGRRKALRVQGRFRTDSAAALAAAVTEGVGIGLAPLWQIRKLLDQGLVEIVLKEFEPAKFPIHAIMPPALGQHDKTRLFVDLLAARMKNEVL